MSGLGLVEAVKVGQREGLEALRDELAVALGECSPAVKAQVAGQLRAVIADLAALGDGSAKVSVVDDLAARRKARRAAAKVAASAAGEGK